MIRQISARPQVLALIALFCGTLSGVFLKCVVDAPHGETVTLRALTAFCCLGAVVVIWPRRGQVGVGWIGLLRAVMDAVAGLTFALAIFNLPLSLLASILATLPIVSVTLSALILSEPLRPRTLVALCLALAGTVLILKPGLGFSALGITLALVSTLTFALRDVVTRRLPAGQDTRKVVLLALGLVTLAALTLVPAGDWMVPDRHDIVLILLSGASFLCSTLFIVLALRQAPVSKIAPLRYTSVFWALIFDAAIWGYVPGPYAWCGIVLIVIAGLLQQTQSPQTGART
ncbi:DMT family transporter [Pseudoruegeria sp. SK021]|uniref:DMT family transporter n=1 Tax=Pseudoruegeria sp. SK021 TaxID=1933035 RepID=UPI000A2531AD|nr:DMT family transporter [Pseudoruegeria sp. SK021]OSP55789.1 hypothetical protein BV911_05245 [Pseudoruegeria sp. SK021]